MVWPTRLPIHTLPQRNLICSLSHSNVGSQIVIASKQNSSPSWCQVPGTLVPVNMCVITSDAALPLTPLVLQHIHLPPLPRQSRPTKDSQLLTSCLPCILAQISQKSCLQLCQKLPRAARWILMRLLQKCRLKVVLTSSTLTFTSHTSASEW